MCVQVSPAEEPSPRTRSEEVAQGALFPICSAKNVCNLSSHPVPSLVLTEFGVSVPCPEVFESVFESLLETRPASLRGCVGGRDRLIAPSIACSSSPTRWCHACENSVCKIFAVAFDRAVRFRVCSRILE